MPHLRSRSPYVSPSAASRGGGAGWGGVMGRCGPTKTSSDPAPPAWRRRRGGATEISRQDLVPRRRPMDRPGNATRQPIRYGPRGPPPPRAALTPFTLATPDDDISRARTHRARVRRRVQYEVYLDGERAAIEHPTASPRRLGWRPIPAIGRHRFLLSVVTNEAPLDRTANPTASATKFWRHGPRHKPE